MCTVLALAVIGAVDDKHSYLRDQTVARLIADRECPGSPNLTVVHSRYHGADHCLCPPNTRCVGKGCSTGQVANGGVYHRSLQGFPVRCGSSCHCVVLPLNYTGANFAGLRARRELWITGTHHKTGSFLASGLWRDLKSGLHVSVNEFHPIGDKKWDKIGRSQTDVLVDYHVTGIGPGLEARLGRPYRFVHLVRDPVAQVVSALLYEAQRILANESVHDIYFKAVRRNIGNMTEALFILADMMMPELNAMVQQYKVTEIDHNGLNVKLEDFTADFDDTVRRMFEFYGVPPERMEVFVRAARKDDLHTKNMSWLAHSSHVTSGKFDKAPLRVMLYGDSRFHSTFKEMKSAMGYVL